jgi:hypothetical protein
MGLLTLQEIFCTSSPDSERTHPLPSHVRRAARAIMPCRTAALGGPSHACPDGPMSRIWSNACRHRACPPCASLQTARWWALQQARLLPCAHSQVLFTLPHALKPLWRANVSALPTLFVQGVRETLGILRAAPQYWGAPPGLIAAWHPWSPTLLWPPPRPCLVTGGGLTPAGQWVAVRHGLLLPARVVQAVLRGKMVDALRQTLARGECALPEARRPQPWRNLLNRLGHPTQTQWHVCILARYWHGAGVVPSLGRDLRGGPITNARLVAWDGERVPCFSRGRSPETEEGTPALQRMPFSGADFLPRWRQHVAVPQTRVVRSYGLYQPMHAAALPLCRTARGPPSVVVPACLAWQTVCAQRGEAHPERCPACGQLLVCTGVIPRGGAPPCLPAEERAA